MSNNQEILKLDNVSQAYNDFRQEVVKGVGLFLKVECIELKFEDKVVKNQINYDGIFNFKDNWEECYFPHSGDPGVYIFLNEQGEAVYVGMSTNAMGNRIASHIKPVDGVRKATFSDDRKGSIESDRVITIPFKNYPFLAPAFEFYLIKRFRPPANHTYIKNHCIGGH